MSSNREMWAFQFQIKSALSKVSCASRETFYVQHITPVPQGRAVLAWKKAIDLALDDLLRRGEIAYAANGSLRLP